MKKPIKTVGSIFIIIMISKLLGQYRESVFASLYGTGSESAAYMAASQIPLNFFDIILGMAIVSAFVPVFNEYRELKGEGEANTFAGKFIGAVFLISFIVSVLGVVFSSTLIHIIVGGFADDIDTAKLASTLLKILFPSMMFTAIAYCYAGILQSYGEFKIPAAMSIVSNAVAIIYMFFLNSRFGIIGVAVSMLAGWILQLAILVIPLAKRHYKFNISLDFRDEGMKKVYKLALPIFLSSWVQPFNVMFNLHLASFLNDGQAVSALSYANRLYLIIASVFTTSVTNVILPELSRLFVQGEKKECAFITQNSVKAAILFLLPVTMLFVVFRVPIIEIIYQRGAFDSNSTYLTSTALLYYSFGMLGYGIQEVMNKSFYSMQKSKIPMRTAFLTIAVNVVLSFVLSKFMGIGGLALAASVAATAGGIVLMIFMKKENCLFSFKNIIICFVKGFIAVIASAIATVFVYNLIAFLSLKGILWKLGVLGICGIVCVVVYVAVLVLLKTEELMHLRRGNN
ncbi:MAG: murein biosynthesis integral membrane protein MurJ [Clostridia bacterium]|nr:murein biosynthesis integral membrane protein MurJ [Clostridia bacterium]